MPAAVRVVREWNKLTEQVSMAMSMNEFEKGLEDARLSLFGQDS